MALEDGHRALQVPLVHPLAKKRLAPLGPEQVQGEASGDRTEGREQRIEDDPFLLSRDGHDDDDIDHFGKREKGRVEKRDEEKASAAERERDHLYPFHQVVHPAECRLRTLHRHRAVPLTASIAAFLAGSAAAFHYASAGLSLAHYDARAHLVVSRRVFDSLTPGWQQVGAVWLPLPHLLNMLPVQNDWLYRTGASAIAFSVLSLAVATWAVTAMIVRVTGSPSGALAAAALILLNPNVLYLQSTPMTEPLLFATTLTAVMLTSEWLDGVRPPGAAGAALAAACWTRYEAWPITGAVAALAFVVQLGRGVSPTRAVSGTLRLIALPAIAIVLFLINSRWTVGAWFVSEGFFVPENAEALGHGMIAFEQIKLGLYQLSGPALVWSAYAGAALIVILFVGRLFMSRLAAGGLDSLLILLGLAASAAVPWYAYLHGHPFRIRYDVPLIAAAGAIAGAGIGLFWRPVQPVIAAVVVAAALMQAHPLDRSAPLIKESQRDAANKAGRATVTAYLVQHYDGATVMMSMGSLGHYMHDLSAQGFRIRDFLHEGNGDIWALALTKPSTVVRWIAIEEKAEGGDELYQEARRHPRFLDGFERVAEGGGVALYRFYRVPQGSRFEPRTP
jgi:hypothetical protein